MLTPLRNTTPPNGGFVSPSGSREGFINDHPFVPCEAPMADVVALTDERFDAFLAENPVVLIDFWAEWCGPCKRLDPIMDALAVKYGGKAAFAKVDVDSHPLKMQSHGVMGLPTMLIFKGGTVVERIVGAYPKAHIEEKLAKHL
jgi:thioredoxin 1